MGKLSEPKAVDFVVVESDSDQESVRRTTEIIEQDKQRPGADERRIQAEQILASVGIDPRTCGMDDPQALLDHWRRCVGDLTRQSVNGQAS